jgi:hypothetical protein
LRCFECGSLGAQRRVRVSATSAPAFRAIRRNSRTGSFRRPTADGATDDLRKARDPLILVARKSIGADLDAVNEGAMVISQWFCQARHRRDEIVQIAIVILGQCGSFSADDNDNLRF